MLKLRVFDKDNHVNTLIGEADVPLSHVLANSDKAHLTRLCLVKPKAGPRAVPEKVEGPKLRHYHGFFFSLPATHVCCTA